MKITYGACNDRGEVKSQRPLFLYFFACAVQGSVAEWVFSVRYMKCPQIIRGITHITALLGYLAFTKSNRSLTSPNFYAHGNS